MANEELFENEILLENERTIREGKNYGRMKFFL
jgi:hypothetical protein